MESSGSTPTPTSPFMYTSDDSGSNQDTPDTTQGHAQYKINPTAVPKPPGPGKRPQFLQHIPSNEYVFPQGGLINATIVDIIVILPQWFRNPGILFRLLNNGITSGVHFAILDEHRHLNLHNPDDVERARDHLSDTYRRVMRKVDPAWTKAKHQVPEDWDEFAMSIHNFVPEAAEKVGYVARAPIPFRDLAIGLKKLPQGSDAGDLTRALEYAMQHQKADGHGNVSEFMFPDDIHVVLKFAGRTHATRDHLDRAVVARYMLALRSAETERRKQAVGGRRMQEKGTEHTETQPTGVNQSYQVHSTQDVVGQHDPYQSPFGNMPMQAYSQQQIQPAPNFSNLRGVYHGMPSQTTASLMPMPMHQSQTHGYTFPSTQLGQFNLNHAYDPEVARSHARNAAASIASQLVARGSEQATVDFPDIPDVCKYDEDVGGEQQALDLANVLQFPEHWTDEQQMEALMAANQTMDVSGLPAPYSSPPHTQVGSWMQQQATGATCASPLPQELTESIDEGGLSHLTRTL